MIKRVCDRCGKELNQQARYDINAQNFGTFAQQAKSCYQYDLCENCMIAVDSFIQRGTDNEKSIKQ